MNNISLPGGVRKISVSTLELLLSYPYWRTAVLETSDKGQVPGNYSPQVIEFFDHQGLLASQVAGYVYKASLPLEHKSEFVAIYFDGELVVFIANREVIINRLGLVSVFGSFDIGGEG